jgi:hypothetical protein
MTAHQLLSYVRSPDDAAHGSPDARQYTYEPTWQMRGLTELHLEFAPVR